MNQSLKTSIGSGAGFPIELTPAVDKDGNPVIVDGKVQYGWHPIEGDINLVKQNVISILTYQIGQRLRQENFGTRVSETLEEPNDQISAFLIEKYVEDGISGWEPRIKNLQVETKRVNEFTYVRVKFQINQDQAVETLTFEYNPNTGQVNAY